SNVLQIGGGSGAEYQACPSTLILDHLFDGAVDPVTVPIPGVDRLVVRRTVTSTLTLVPCGDDFVSQTPGSTTAQFLGFNEVEQRFWRSRTVNCLLDSQLSNIDTRNPTRSIFSAGVAGTIAGQTRIRGVGSAATGNGLLGVAQMLVSNSF